MRTLIALSVLAFAASGSAAAPVSTNGQNTGITAGCIGSVTQQDGTTVARGVGNCPHQGDVSSTNQSGGVTAGVIGTVNQGDAAQVTMTEAQQPIGTSLRDCLRNQDMGPRAPRPTTASATYFYIVTVMFEADDGRYGSTVGWAVKRSLREACDYALDNAHQDHPSDDGWNITGANVTLVPDTILRQGLAH